MALRLRGKWVLIPFFWFCLIPFCFSQQKLRLRFGKNGEFKILQIADLHFANGKTTHCLDVLPSQYASCSDLNTTAFIQRIILSEKPNLIVFTGIPILFLLFISFYFSAQTRLFWTLSFYFIAQRCLFWKPNLSLYTFWYWGDCQFTVNTKINFIYYFDQWNAF